MPTKHHSAISYRRDIDGLRALAILLVIIFHAFPKFLRGGFIGVDIFFVISGYLITSIILRGQHQQNFSLFEFYSRRIRRIFPSLIVVLFFCLVVGWYVLLNHEYELLGKHIAIGSIYFSNIALQNESGYFDTGTELKPLLHLWSLSIEEQFYLVFPLLLIIANRFNINALLAILLCLTTSFYLNITQITHNPTKVFFFPYTRAWELLIGSFVACVNISFYSLNHHTKKFSNAFAWIGVTLIVVAWYCFDSQKILFPSWWALMPTLGAACLIIASENAWFNRTILASTVAVYIGLISYPLYLWHWVLLSFLRITEMEKPSALIRITTLIVSFILAWGTYYFVEKKIRFHQHKLTSIGLLICLALIGCLGYFINVQKGYPSRYLPQLSWVTGDIGNEVFKNKGFIAQKSCVENYAKVAYEQYPNDEFCLIQVPEQPPTALLLGDSHANHLYAGLIDNPAITGGNLLNLGAGGCFPFFDNPSNPNPKCRQLINEVLKKIMVTPSITTVILANRAITKINEHSFMPKKNAFAFFKNDAQAASENDPYIIFQQGMKKTIPALLDAKKKVIVILDIPEIEFDPIACLNRPWRLSGQLAKTPCAIPRSQVEARRQKYLEITRSILSQFPAVTILDPLPALCDTQYCWAIKDNKMLYRDDNHLNEVGAAYLGAYFARK